uniref:Protein SirB1 N-terminal domain-containing protein n=1 Tax=Tetraselmis chuii TaxID=63592 RepID=A0A7S1X0T8_9CHLO|mmetsp:Transcript_17485/g.31230  ORF Transcript_17485/g.31230 Transcript_17485/m.31230 type:complete len:422 (+) Transcript_17485:73-1338(+)|eukprot:CAMPEP_0177772910 /NCGR_PEP_ID=MMETSP0491_2-20121128/12535_1 /TAXON_ID=63592 /ORGANISM="Tetraselmis chuii, Strain PLY429" /LENGTH=421 /DNA_ID=CAMNT_0019290873 /DNA_START=20 /DNA_END=1285 /DNA_ORIENTATION=+
MSARFVACARLSGSAAAQPRNPRHLIRAPGVARSPFSHTDAGVPGVRQRGIICLRASDEDSEGASYEFGRPAAPKETYQAFANDSRAALLDEMGKDDADIDVVWAALHIASEDDAVQTRSVVKLPVASYSKRLDTMVEELIRLHLPKLGDSPSPKAMLDCVDNYIYDLMKYKLAEGWLELFSPYRLYAHNVLAQKCGTPLGLAVVHLGILQRLQCRGQLDGFDFELVLPSTGERPFAQVRGEGVDTEGLAGSSLTSRVVVLMVLDALKRSFWPWEWAPGAKSGFLPAAEAALGSSGRIGTADSTTGVLQAQGRPFGDLSRTMVALERLVLLKAPPMHLRDSGIVLYHLKRYEEAYHCLKKYKDILDSSSDLEEHQDVPDVQTKPSLEGIRTELETIATEESLVEAVITKLERIKAESSWAL